MEASDANLQRHRCLGAGRKARWALIAGVACIASVGALGLGLVAGGERVPLDSAAAARARTHAARVHEARTAPGRDEAALHFVKYALNALLVPLLDDDSPPRWSDPSLSFDCDAVEVTVDGAALDAGAPVQDGSFTVRWHMERCRPFEDRLELTGDIELSVEPSGQGYRALVKPMALHVVSARGLEVLTEAFTAGMSLGR